MHDNTNPEYNYVQMLINKHDDFVHYIFSDTNPITFAVMNPPTEEEAQNEIPSEIPGVVSEPIDYVYRSFKVREKNLKHIDSVYLSNNVVVQDNGDGDISFGSEVEIIEELPTPAFEPDA